MTYVDRLSACCLHEFSYALFVFMLKGKKSRKNTKKFDQNELKPRAMLEVQHQIGMGFFSPCTLFRNLNHNSNLLLQCFLFLKNLKFMFKPMNRRVLDYLCVYFGEETDIVDKEKDGKTKR